MNKIVKEWLTKNILLAIILIALYPTVSKPLLFVANQVDKTILGNLIVAISIISVVACFGNFGFTYEKIKANSFFSRFLGHLTTGLLTLIIGLTLEMTSILTSILIGNYLIFNITLILLYIACVLYDLWDLRRLNLV